MVGVRATIAEVRAVQTIVGGWEYTKEDDKPMGNVIGFITERGGTVGRGGGRKDRRVAATGVAYSPRKCLR